MRITPIQTARFNAGQDLVAFIESHVVKRLREGDVLVVTSKIVALAESRIAPLSDKKRLMRTESEWIAAGRIAPIALKDGLFMAFAGIDESNANGQLVLLPTDSFAAAERLRTMLAKRYNLRRIGVLITDSHVTPLRAGVVGVALGYAGFKGIKDYRGKRDMFGRPMKVSRVDVADCLASGAVLMMGEGKEQTPLAIIRGAPVTFVSAVEKKELLIHPCDDLYAPIFKFPKRHGR